MAKRPENSLHIPRKIDYNQRWWFYLVKTFDFFRIYLVRNDNPSLEARIWSLCHFDLNIFTKLKNENPVIGIISSQIIICDKCNMDNELCVLIAVVTTLLIELTISFFRICTVRCLFCIVKHTHLLIMEAFYEWNFFNPPV